MNLPQYSWEDYHRDYSDRHLLHGVVAKWAAERPHQTAIIEFDTGREVTYQELHDQSTALALRLVELGYRKGDFLATLLPLTVEHILLEYACFQIGVIHAPLDTRLKADEIVRSLGLIQAKGFVTPRRAADGDEPDIAEAVRGSCDYLQHLLICGEGNPSLPGELPASALFQVGPATRNNASLVHRYKELSKQVCSTDGAQVIYTTGSTGLPKPALLSHRNITVQNLCLAGGAGLLNISRWLVNLPPSHVGCQAEELMTIFFTGATAVILHRFDPEMSLRAIERYQVEAIGQIPSMFQMQWHLPHCANFDLRSVRVALFGGQQVTRPFVQQLCDAFPQVGTGLGLTEMAGFVTYTGPTRDVDYLVNGVGMPMPITPLSIRRPMKSDGTAGDELPAGATGEICFQGPQVFIDYVGHAEAYHNTVSSDGVCYTGDLGCVNDRGLVLAGRSKLVIKPKGFQVHPAQIEQHFAHMEDNVGMCAAVGQPHDLLGEAIVLFVAPKPGHAVSQANLLAHAQGIASYMRPTHYMLLEAGGFPLNRTGKSDYHRLKQMAAAEIERLRSLGRWDAAE